MKFSELVKKHCPEITKKIEENKNLPTDKERIEALENAVADLTLKTMGVITDD